MTARDHYVTAFEAFAGNGAGGTPDWVLSARRDAMARFAEAGFPTTRQEDWRFTDLKPIVREAHALSSKAVVPSATVAQHRVDGFDALCVLANGRFSSEHSQIVPNDGVMVSSLADAWNAGSDIVREHLMRYVNDSANPFVSLNSAFLSDGVLVHIGRGVEAPPIQLLHVMAPGGDHPEVSHPRVLVVLEDGAHGTIVEQYVGVGKYWTNAVTEIVVGQNANLDLVRIQEESEKAHHTAATYSHQGRDSRITHVVFTFGAAMSRHNIVSVLNGDGAESTLNGLSVLSGKQHADYHTVLDHAKPHCNSWEYFNGVFDDRARGVFNGRIIVREGAQKTDAKQTNNNLLLSDHARADSQPQLEIYADDVRCTHGATLGPIDQAHLFYLQSRGLPLAQARRLLTYGFASEILNGVEHQAVRERLDRMVRTRLESTT